MSVTSVCVFCLDRFLVSGWLITVRSGGRLRRLPAAWLRLWSLIARMVARLGGERQTCADSHLLLMRGRVGLLALLAVLELCVQVRVDAEGLDSLVVLDFGRALSLI